MRLDVSANDQTRILEKAVAAAAVANMDCIFGTQKMNLEMATAAAALALQHILEPHFQPKPS